MSFKGCKHSEESRAKNSKANKGKKLSIEHRAKISAANTGKKRTPETCTKMSEARKGVKLSPEHIAKLSEAHKGYVVTDETKAKISAAHRGMKRSLESRKKMSESARNKPPMSEETKRKLSKALKGKKLSPEHCAKISEAFKGDKHPMWKGGISTLPYCEKFNEDLKERTRENYGRVCVECGKTEKDNGKKLAVHHVNFDKESCCNKNTPLFVCLCTSCHMKTNFNREYWEEKYTILINEKYGGKCYYSKEEYAQIKQEA